MSVKEATERLEAAQDVMSQEDRKRKEAETMAKLAQSPEWMLFCDFLDQIGTKYINDLMSPTDKPWHADYLRGILKGLDTAKSLPENVQRLYAQNQAQAQAALEAQQKESSANPEMRLDPEGDADVN